jgi:hypothetical protein
MNATTKNYTDNNPAPNFSSLKDQKPAGVPIKKTVSYYGNLRERNIRPEVLDAHILMLNNLLS